MAARGVHHIALLSFDVERTVRSYQDVLGSPTSSRTATIGVEPFFFDIGHGNLLAFFDFPDLGLRPYAEMLGRLHHVAISMTPDEWQRAKTRLDEAGVPASPRAGPRSTSATPTAPGWS